MYSFSYLEPVCCSISSSNCCFLTCIYVSLVFPILLLSSISFYHSLKKAFLSLLAILWNFASRWVYLSFAPWCITSVTFLAICKACSDNHFAFIHLFFLGMVLIKASRTMSQMSFHSFSGTLSDLIP